MPQADKHSRYRDVAWPATLRGTVARKTKSSRKPRPTRLATTALPRITPDLER